MSFYCQADSAWLSPSECNPVIHESDFEELFKCPQGESLCNAGEGTEVDEQVVKFGCCASAVLQEAEVVAKASAQAAS